ncbi:hypothetical protein FSP39_007542 [Pinctada imbricata]|uniref:Arginine kinase n=1 Tax=Pinctada imbricata TaxID=66713 RepID=A0AA89C062_PINIB|nr:hypothetical protein FSP39_007542 [Pinctada imbricata]
MSGGEVKKIWVEINRLDLEDEVLAKGKIACVEIHEDDGIKEVKSRLCQCFHLNDTDLVFKLRNHRGSLIPIKGSIPSNSKSVPYQLEILRFHQNITPKPRSVKLASHMQAAMKKLQELMTRTDSLESDVPELNQRRLEKIRSEMNDLDKKLGFLNKRLNEADNSHWKGMFKKQPFWYAALHSVRFAEEDSKQNLEEKHMSTDRLTVTYCHGNASSAFLTATMYRSYCESLTGQQGPSANMDAKQRETEDLYKKLIHQSLLKKHLTTQVFNNLKAKRTSLGGTLADCIRSGCLHLNSGVGVYACDPEGYEVFKDLLDPVIKEYHATNEIKHPKPNFGDMGKLGFSDLDPEGKMIVSTRVRVGRSHAKFPFPPVATKEQRIEMERITCEALNTLTGELAGKYTSLGKMTKEEEKQLVEDHFLFKDDDPMLRDAGGYNDWPIGRGIFFSKDKKFLVWINEEDHLRFISMQKGGDLAEVYKRLVKAIHELEKKLTFAKTDRHGYLTFCPTNLGTTMRASVHIKVPFLADAGRLKEVCDKYQLQPRGIHGEHTESVGGVYDISNKRRLGLTEFEAISGMSEGIKKIMEEEIIERPKFLERKVKALQSSNSKSLLKKHLTPKVFEALKDKKTKLKGDLLDCAMSGLLHHNSGVGVYACDPEGYEVFKDLLDAVIKDYHKVPEVKHPKPSFGDMDNLGFGDLDPEGKMIISTRVRVGRSHENFPFPPVASKQQRIEMERITCDALKTLSGDLAGKYTSLSSMTKEEEKQLVEDHFLFKDDDPMLRDAGGYNDWPTGRGIFFSADKKFLVWINEEDHLRFISMQKGGNLAEVYKRLVKAIQELEKKLKFAKTDRHGYLTFCPTNLGTTMRASVHIKVPYLARSGKLNEECAKFNLQPRGIHGEHTESVGGVYDISNKRRLGLTEFEAITEMRKGIEEIIKLEKEARKKFLDEEFTKLNKSNSKSLLKVHLTQDLFNKLKDKKTSLGGDLLDCAKSGLLHHNSGVGVYACDPEGYGTFSDLLDAVIKDYHKVPEVKHPKPEFGDMANLGFSDLDPAGEMIVSTRVRVGRSHEGFPFPPAATLQQRLDMEKRTVQALNTLEGELAGKYTSLKSMTKEEEKQLVEDHFLFKDDDPMLRDAGGYDDWPYGRGIFFSADKKFLVWINEEDHLRFISMQKGGNLAEVYKRLVKAIQTLEKKLTFAKTDRHGYLTFCPTNLGTTMRASVHIKVPNLAKSGKLNEICAKHNLQPRGIHGEHTESVGGVYDISNKRRLGLSEFEAITEMRKGIEEVMKAEKAAASGQTKI